MISTAGRLFTEKGYRAVSMADIAASLDWSVGALYNYFPDKLSLCRAWLATVWTLPAGEESGAADIKAAVTGLFRRYLKALTAINKPLLRELTALSYAGDRKSTPGFWSFLLAFEKELNPMIPEAAAGWTGILSSLLLRSFFRYINTDTDYTQLERESTEWLKLIPLPAGNREISG